MISIMNFVVRRKNISNIALYSDLVEHTIKMHNRLEKQSQTLLKIIKAGQLSSAFV